MRGKLPNKVPLMSTPPMLAAPVRALHWGGRYTVNLGPTLRIRIAAKVYFRNV